MSLVTGLRVSSLTLIPHGYNRLSHPFHRELLFSMLVRSGCDLRVGYLGELYLYVVPSMVPNQRQLFIIVSDWGSYLGCHFPNVLCGIMSIFSCL